MVGQTIEIGQDWRRHGLHLGQGADQAFRPAHHGSGVMKMRRRRRAAGQNERRQRGEAIVHRIDLAFETFGQGRGHAQARLAAVARAGVGHAEVGAEVEQIVLDPRQHGIGFALGVKAGKADHRICLVHRAVGRDPRTVLGHTLAVTERRLAAIAATGIDSIEFDHALFRRSAGAAILAKKRNSSLAPVTVGR